MQFAALSTAFAFLPALGLATLFTLYRFPLRTFFISCLTSLLAVPTVVIGLGVYTLLSRSGPLGHFDWLFTPKAVVLGQTLFVFPILTTYLMSGFSELSFNFFETLQALRLKGVWKFYLTWREASSSLVLALLSSFARVISEVGVSMMLGGNIRFYTRTMTTAIALNTTRGEYEQALALGILLLIFSVGLNLLVHGVVRYGD